MTSRKCSFHAFKVSALGIDQNNVNDVIWHTLTNPNNYTSGVSKLTSTHFASGYKVEIREFSNDENIALGCLAKRREDSPPIRNPDGTEVLRPLRNGQAYLEKNYFLYEKSSGILIWHFNLSGNSYSAFATMLAALTGSQQAFICQPIVNRREMDFNSIEIEYVDFAVIMPKRKGEKSNLLNQNPTDWGRLNPYQTMENLGANKFSGKFTAKRNQTLNERLGRFVTSLSSQPSLRKLKVKIEDCEEPIDVLASRFKASRDIHYVGGQHLDSASMFSALRDVWSTYQQPTVSGS